MNTHNYIKFSNQKEAQNIYKQLKKSKSINNLYIYKIKNIFYHTIELTNNINQNSLFVPINQCNFNLNSDKKNEQLSNTEAKRQFKLQTQLKVGLIVIVKKINKQININFQPNKYTLSNTEITFLNIIPDLLTYNIQNIKLDKETLQFTTNKKITESQQKKLMKGFLHEKSKFNSKND